MDYGSFSNYADVESSVPQGAVLGPLIEILILIVNWQDSRLSITQLSIVGSGVTISKSVPKKFFSHFYEV